MKKEQWEIYRLHLINATEQEVIDWCIIQNKIGKDFHAALRDNSIIISKQSTSKINNVRL